MTRVPRHVPADFAAARTLCTAAILPAAARTLPEAGAARIRERMDVVGVDGRHVGTVERVAGGRIGDDPDAQGHAPALPVTWAGAVGGGVHLTETAEQAFAR